MYVQGWLFLLLCTRNRYKITTFGLEMHRIFLFFGLEMLKKLLVFGLEMIKKYAIFGLEMKIKLYLCT